jgi:hypothetical protein
MVDTFLVQVFLSDNGTLYPNIFEVGIAKEDMHLECTCPGYIAKSSCKHTKTVQMRMDENNGVYPYNFSRKFTAEEVVDAAEDPAKFRELVITYGKIEAI